MKLSSDFSTSTAPRAGEDGGHRAPAREVIPTPQQEQ